MALGSGGEKMKAKAVMLATMAAISTALSGCTTADTVNHNLSKKRTNLTCTAGSPSRMRELTRLCCGRRDTCP